MSIETIKNIEGITAMQSFLKNYDFENIDEAQYFKKLYFGAEEDSAGIGYLLRGFQLTGQPATTDAVHDSTTETKQLDLDFDITFNQQKVIEGDAIINIKGAYTQTQAGVNEIYYIKAIVKHYDGSTETTIGTTIGPTHTNENTTDCLKVSLTKKKFLAGETLRITIEVYAWHSGAGGNSVTFTLYHNPKNDISVAWIPFNITDV